MASIGLINLGILPLLLEAMTPAYAPHDQREPESGGQHQEQDAKAGAPNRPGPGKERTGRAIAVTSCTRTGSGVPQGRWPTAPWPG